MIRAVLLALLAAAVAVPVGHFVAHWAGWSTFCLGLALQMIFHFRNFARLDRWSRQPLVDASLEGEGEWDNIFGRLYRHEKDLRDQIARRDQEIAMLIAAGQALTDGVVLLDTQNHIMFCNTTAETQLGLKVATDRGQSIVNLVRQPEFVAYLEAGDFSRPLTLRPERYKDRVYAIHVIPYAGNRRLMQIKDVTQADRLDQTRRDFVANVSHELRTPLTVLAGFLETMQEIDLDDDERRRYLGMMADQSRRMQSIVQDLLTLSSIESAPPPDNDVVDMASLIDKLRRDAEALSGGRHNIVVESDGRGDLRGSEPELISALANLVTNAVRYTPAGGKITLHWQTSPQGAEFAVQDTGPGIDPKHIPRLTERFYRVDRGRSRDSGGTGLGLAIVKHSLNRHQAQLDIKSELGVGSRFAARFPASRVANG
ncbi:phosphate regulon sensor histidine kinase PhoR [Dechloromonas sp. XY25]|uniref:Phosphate regulon sensor protein PhoR n=1 Tax=Dechloromonas hankyongensis TaxID=2908002 RepID=A0ABS9JZT7_9RHOO|nr:phosphate regulon sensor histidine kinase PhoR [Dechloromonas hankyongensis]MCG2576433.1 phosphate regulon sensor histidine kinase PhoR [Dechloromonas hankyongensis]